MIILKILGILIVLSGCYAVWQYFELKKFEVTKYRIYSDKLKNEHCFVILADLHGYEYGAENEQLLQKIKEVNPRGILIAGDMVVSKDTETYQRAVQLLKQLVKIAPVYYSFGNHESKAARKGLMVSKAFSAYIKEAKALGFDTAVAFDPVILEARQDIRDMCAADQCRAYGKNWTCPPYCGTLEECSHKLQQYSRGILLQTIGKTEKVIDTKAYRRTEAQHLAQFHQLCEKLRPVYPHALCLGSGGCRICGKCAFPESCRFPEKACSSMEAYGLFVTEVCRRNELSYHYGEGTITYTACILF